MLGQTRVASAQEKYAVTVLNECELRSDCKILLEEQYKLLSLFQTLLCTSFPEQTISYMRFCFPYPHSVF